MYSAAYSLTNCACCFSGSQRYFVTPIENVQSWEKETIILECELSQPGVEVIWCKGNIALSLSEGRFQTVNKDCSYQLVIPTVTVEDSGTYTVQAGEVASSADVVIHGQFGCKLLLNCMSHSYRNLLTLLTFDVNL